MTDLNLLPGHVEAVAAFLKLRDEEVFDPDERTDEEREESARRILQILANLDRPKLLSEKEAVPVIVSAMVAAGYLVEATNKRDHRADHLPVDSYGGWSARENPVFKISYAEENFGSLLVGGWWDKGALARLIVEVWRAARRQKP